MGKKNKKKNKKTELSFAEQRKRDAEKLVESKNSKSSKQLSQTLKYLGIFLVVVIIFSSVIVYQKQIRKFFGIKNAPKPVDEATLRGYHTRLRKLYEKYAPEKLDEGLDLDDVLAKWRGKEKQLFKTLHEKYVKPAKAEEKRRKEEEKNLSPEERMRRQKEREREKRRKERREERDIDDEEELEALKKKKKKKYWEDDNIADDNLSVFDGNVEVVDWKPQSANELLYGCSFP